MILMMDIIRSISASDESVFQMFLDDCFEIEKVMHLFVSRWKCFLFRSSVIGSPFYQEWDYFGE